MKCQALREVLPTRLIFPGSSQYDSEKRSYWSTEASDVDPACFVRPANTTEVSYILQILKRPEYDSIPACQFAIRSGGHQTWGGASSQPGGVTIDLSSLNKMSIYEKDNVISVAPGLRWQNVYDALEPHNLAVSGGRWGNVGVGGLLLGGKSFSSAPETIANEVLGGLSFFQGTYSLSCDNVINHEVVLANGTIVNANKNENVDLHKALKGGNNNFGIVTRFDLRGFPQGNIWSGHTYASAGRQNIPHTWFEKFASHRNNDLGGMIMFYSNYALGGWTNQAFVSYVKPVDEPQVFKGLTQASNSVTADITTMQQVARENAIMTPSGTRSSFSTFTIINSARYMDALLDLGTEYVNALPILSTLNIIWQPLWTKPRMRSFNYGGGNVLGLEKDRRDLVICLVHTIWLDSAQSEEVKENMRQFINRATQLAKEMSVHHPYLYLNYAESFQDVMSSYGSESVNFMKQTAAKYDPTGLFQRRVPGGFKLPRSDRYPETKNDPHGPSASLRQPLWGSGQQPVISESSLSSSGPSNGIPEADIPQNDPPAGSEPEDNEEPPAAQFPPAGPALPRFTPVAAEARVPAKIPA